MGKKAKEHRKKVAARNEKINTAKKQLQKQQERFLMDLIQREKEAGKFNSPTETIVDVPEIDLTDGPQL
jgi:ABC-type Fe3+-citrate transport system substrate-binding protein